MTNTIETAEQIANQPAWLAAARALPQIAIGTKVRSKSHGYVGVVVAHLAPFMGIHGTTIEFSTKTLDTLEPMTDRRGFTVDDLEVIA